MKTKKTLLLTLLLVSALVLSACGSTAQPAPAPEAAAPAEILFAFQIEQPAVKTGENHGYGRLAQIQVGPESQGYG